MDKNRNPIENGIRMADMLMTAFGIAPLPRRPIFAVEPQPTPTYSLNTQLELSVLQADIDEAQAKLDTQNALEEAHRNILVAHYAMLAYHASRCRDRLATRQWVQVPGEEAIAMSRVEVEVTTASGNHDDMVDTIAELQGVIRKLQAKFDAVAREKQVANG